MRPAPSSPHRRPIGSSGITDRRRTGSRLSPSHRKRVVIASREPVTVDLPIAFNDPPGDYEIIVTDSLTVEAVFNKLDEPMALGYCNAGMVIDAPLRPLDKDQ